MSDQKFIIIYGVPGSGKSTIAHAAAQEHNAVIVNMDTIRTELFGEQYHTNMGKMNNKERSQCERRVESTKISRIRQFLKDGKNVISDDTNINLGRVQKMVDVAREFNVDVVPFGVNVPVSTAKSRNASRGANGGRLVPGHVIDAMAKNAYTDGGVLKNMVVEDNGVVRFTE